MLLSNFQILRPPYESDQETSLNWLIQAHTESEKQKQNPNLPEFAKTLSEKLWRIGCKPNRIEKRGHILADYLHTNWDQMEVYRLSKSPSGENLSIRSQHFGNYVDTVFEQYYPEGSSPPDDLVHVSCTGYVSPSGAQKLASKRTWGHHVTITHAYHMGCYASIPAIRMASGFLALDSAKHTADIVHTEICSLHVNPGEHQADQLVSQSLFADGFIKYTVQKQTNKTHFKILSIQEEIIPNSIYAMTWNVVDWGFKMSLAKEIPVLIARALPLFVERIAKKANIPLERLLKTSLFAVHPGGPQILLHVQKVLGLEDPQLAYSFKILKMFGNMSSATLPHIWESILKDPTVPNNTLIVSMAFGPGLSVTGSIMEKVCGV